MLDKFIIESYICSISLNDHRERPKNRTTLPLRGETSVKKQESMVRKRQDLMQEAKTDLFHGNLMGAAKVFREVALICSELCEFEQAINFSNQAEKLDRLFKSTREAILKAT